MVYGESDCHVTDDVLKGQVVTPIRLKPNISKTVEDAVEQQSLITRIVFCEAVRSAILAILATCVYS